MLYELVKLSLPLGFNRILQANIASRQPYRGADKSLARPD